MILGKQVLPREPIWLSRKGEDRRGQNPSRKSFIDRKKMRKKYVKENKSQTR